MNSITRMVRSSACVVAALVLAAPVLHAQSLPQTRQGLWFSGGLGVGSFGCEDCDDRETGPTAQISLGGTVSPRLQLGASLNMWTKKVAGVRLTQSALLALAKFYPTVTSGFFLQGGAGFGQARASFDGESESETGPSLMVGAGYDFRVAPNVSLTPFVNAVGGRFDGANTNFVQLGLSVTGH
ncbi:MAG: outer membrane beta-barrel protein [Gemmatimonadota bacterium]